MRSCERIGRFLQGRQCPQLRIFRSQPVEEVQQSVDLLPTHVLDRRLRESIQRLTLHLQVCLDVLVRRLRALVSQPEGDHCDI